MEKRQREDVGQLRRILALVRPHRWRFFAATFTLLAGSGIGLIYPEAAKYAIDLGMSEGSFESLNRVIVVLVAVFSVHAVLVMLRHYLMSWLGERVVADLRIMVFERLIVLPTGWFHDQRAGELVGRLAADVTTIQGVVGSELSIALRNGVQLLGGLVLLFVFNTHLTLYMLAVVPPFIVGAMIFGRAIRRMSVKVQDKLAQASGQVQEAVGAIQTVQAFVQEQRELRNYSAGVDDAFEQARRLAVWRAWFFAVVTVIGYLAISIIIWLGGRDIIRGELSAGEMTRFILYTFIVAGALVSLAGLWGSLQRAAGATKRLFAIVDKVPDIRDPEQAIALPAGPVDVVFEDVGFRYPSRPDHDVLMGIDFRVAAGRVVALVGPSGSGKTTIASLLLRLYDVDSGTIRLGDVDIRSAKLSALRRTMAIVAQEPVLFSGTIASNIAYAREGASMEDIAAAARDANAHDFIVGFPDGYKTVVGERGVKLSGGQRQRIAIARAVLADPRILILDEATSNLDAESEALVQQALARLMAGRTTLVVAHRLSTIRDADEIIVLDGGRIAERGDHDSLMAGGGIYRKLVEHQIVKS